MNRRIGGKEEGAPVLGTIDVDIVKCVWDTSRMVESELTRRIIQAAMRVHTELGPGLLESIYESSLHLELAMSGLKVMRQVDVPVAYHGRELGFGFRADLIVENRVVIELKSVEHLLPVHRAQLITYMKLMSLPAGLLINFNSVHLRDGIRRCFAK